MNREMRRLQEAEERRRKKQEGGQTRAQQRAAAATKTQQQPAAERKSFFKRVGNYLHEVRQELRKVTWPNRDQMVAFTTVTVITAVVLTGVIFAFDMGAKRLVLEVIEMMR